MRSIMYCSVAVILLSIGSILGAFAIDTVDKLDASKYTGVWYEVYSNAYTRSAPYHNLDCPSVHYTLDEPTGNITLVNYGRLEPIGKLVNVTGYVYTPDDSEPGQLKLHLKDMTEDGDYWVAGLGPETYGPEELYEWAIVTDPTGSLLFVLVRDLREFHDLFADHVLDVLHDLDFVGPAKEPQLMVQKGCPPPFNQTVYASESVEFVPKVPQVESMPSLKQVMQAAELASKAGDMVAPVDTVDELDLDSYSGRWYQAYASLSAAYLFQANSSCVTADYKKENETVLSVLNTGRVGGVYGKLIEVEGIVAVPNTEEPGKMVVKLENMPIPGPYWVVALGDKNRLGYYKYSIISDPNRIFLRVLVRNIFSFPGSSLEEEVLAVCEELGYTALWNSPHETTQDGCIYTKSAAKAFS